MDATTDYITLPQIARALHKPYREVYELLLRGVLDGDKIGGQWHVDPASFQRYAGQQMDTTETSDRLNRQS